MSESRSVLVVGIEPGQVDFSDPDLPPGMNADRIEAGLAMVERQFIDQGDHVDMCRLSLDGSAEAVLVAQLARTDYDCVVIGAGLRRPASQYLLFEAVINAIHRHAPGAAIAFNTRPEDSVEAAERWLSRG
jgi:hypothetical protein